MAHRAKFYGIKLFIYGVISDLKRLQMLNLVLSFEYRLINCTSCDTECKAFIKSIYRQNRGVWSHVKMPYLMSSSVTMKALQRGWDVLSQTAGFFSTAAETCPVIGAELVCRALATADRRVSSLLPGPTPAMRKPHCWKRSAPGPVGRPLPNTQCPHAHLGSHRQTWPRPSDKEQYIPIIATMYQRTDKQWPSNKTSTWKYIS